MKLHFLTTGRDCVFTFRSLTVLSSSDDIILIYLEEIRCYVFRQVVVLPSPEDNALQGS